MAETVSNAYDLTYPSPITLKKISSIVVAVELWLKEICTHLESKRVQKLDLENNIPVRTVLPMLPSTIYSLLEEYVDRFRRSIVTWQIYHLGNVFNHSNLKNVLRRFHDFAWDWDGTIHEARTAKRMMLCDRLTEDEKFKLACLYCLEDDIKRIWPSVSDRKNLNEINFRTCPQQYYWICYLRNELHKIPNPRSSNYPIDEFMIFSLSKDECRSMNGSSIMYFWNRLPSNRQSPLHDCIPILKHVVIFSRFILPKLNKRKLDTFVAAKGTVLIRDLLKSESTLVQVHVLPTWMYIRSRINMKKFSHLINDMLEPKLICVTYCLHRIEANLFSKIWNSVPQDFKRSVLDDVLYNDRLFLSRNLCDPENNRMKFLITVLQDAALEERNAFWHKYWRQLIFSAPVEDSIFIMKFFFSK
ncbi:uncharacterized protein LOC135834205 [Planococcus citri]|uniref:uncharacterized protein LOC135834205 n=1 Tax=Planococcus citri TaxID=170843 RepID=UPI0031F9D086